MLNNHDCLLNVYIERSFETLASSNPWSNVIIPGRVRVGPVSHVTEEFITVKLISRRTNASFRSNSF